MVYMCMPDGMNKETACDFVVKSQAGLGCLDLQGATSLPAPSVSVLLFRVDCRLLREFFRCRWSFGTSLVFRVGLDEQIGHFGLFRNGL